MAEQLHFVFPVDEWMRIKLYGHKSGRPRLTVLLLNVNMIAGVP